MHVNETERREKSNNFAFSGGNASQFGKLPECCVMFSVAEADALRFHCCVSVCWGWGTASDTAYNRHLHNHDFRGQEQAVNEPPQLRNVISEHSL